MAQAKTNVVLSRVRAGSTQEVVASIRSTEIIRGRSYDRRKYAVVAPSDASYVELIVDRKSIANVTDGELCAIAIEISLDGGVTWGGTFDLVDERRGTIKQFPLEVGALLGGGDSGGRLAEGLTVDASRGTELPPDQGLGRLVRAAIGLKQRQPVGLTISFS